RRTRRQTHLRRDQGHLAARRHPRSSGRPIVTASGTQGYGENAAALADQYESIAFADVHRDVIHLIPAAPARVADIGAGSGRDAAALARMGHAVVAAEPTPELRREGQRRHAL